MDMQNVTLGGQTFPVPPLPIKTLRTVVPAIIALTGATDGSNAPEILDASNFDKLCDTVFAGIAVGSPGFTRAAFDDLPATPAELIAALTVVSMQTGMKAAAGEERATGEV